VRTPSFSSAAALWGPMPLTNWTGAWRSTLREEVDEGPARLEAQAARPVGQREGGEDVEALRPLLRPRGLADDLGHEGRGQADPPTRASSTSRRPCPSALEKRPRSSTGTEPLRKARRPAPAPAGTFAFTRSRSTRPRATEAVLFEAELEARERGRDLRGEGEVDVRVELLLRHHDRLGRRGPPRAKPPLHAGHGAGDDVRFLPAQAGGRGRPDGVPLRGRRLQQKRGEAERQQAHGSMIAGALTAPRAGDGPRRCAPSRAAGRRSRGAARGRPAPQGRPQLRERLLVVAPGPVSAAQQEVRAHRVGVEERRPRQLRHRRLRVAGGEERLAPGQVLLRAARVRAAPGVEEEAVSEGSTRSKRRERSGLRSCSRAGATAVAACNCSAASSAWPAAESAQARARRSWASPGSRLTAPRSQNAAASA